MPEEPLPACSSREVENALKRLGFEPKRRTAGGHQVYSGKVGDRTRTTSVPMAKSRIPKGTLESIIELAGLTLEQFRKALR